MSHFRYRLFQVFLALVFVVFVARLFQFQILEWFKHKAEVRKFHQSLRTDTVRGEIVDRFGKILAFDVSKYTVEYNPVDTEEDRYLLAEKLKKIFDFEDADLLFKKSSQTLTRNLNKEQAEQIKALNSKLLYLRKTTVRFYPQGHLASHVLGYVDLYGKSKQGVESRYEDFLVDGPERKLYLSIDSRLQALAEKSLQEQIKETKAARGAILVMNTRTGEVLTWAVYPDFNPNSYYDSPIEHIKNWSLSDVYQPGSIFKIITVAAALDSKTVDPDYKFVDRGYIEVDKWKISNHDYVPNETKPAELDIGGLFQRSSNPFAAYLALATGVDNFYNYIKLFGFGNKTGIELPGESRGILKKASHWRRSDVAATGIGHGAISVTPLQLLAAVNAVANDGVWIKPTVLMSGKNHLEAKDDEKIRVISSNVAKTVSKFLAESLEYNVRVKNKIAGNVPGISVAGKTGTTEKLKVGGGYHKDRTIASFIGFLPAENPKFIALVVIDDPQTSGGWGDTVAGPLFNKVAIYCKNFYY